MRVPQLKRRNREIKLLRQQRENELYRRNVIKRELNGVLEALVTGQSDRLCFQVVRDLSLFVTLLNDATIRSVYDLQQISSDTFVFWLKTI